MPGIAALKKKWVLALLRLVVVIEPSVRPRPSGLGI
jgi:hypothetical protein